MMAYGLGRNIALLPIFQSFILTRLMMAYGLGRNIALLPIFQSFILTTSRPNH